VIPLYLFRGLGARLLKLVMYHKVVNNSFARSARFVLLNNEQANNVPSNVHPLCINFEY